MASTELVDVISTPHDSAQGGAGDYFRNKPHFALESDGLPDLLKENPMGFNPIDFCPVCTKRLRSPAEESDHGVYPVRCLVCGIFQIPFEVTFSLPRLNEKQRSLLSGVIRNAAEHGRILTILEENIDELLDTAPKLLDPYDALNRILFYIQRKSKNMKELVPITSETDYPIIYAYDSGELSYLLTIFVDAGYLEMPKNGKFRPTLKGWERLSEISKNIVDSFQAFVAMWFDDSLKPAWEEGFDPALYQVGYDAVKMNLIEYNEKICDRVIAEIRKSGVLVADFSGHRPNVYYEAGFAQGLGIPVIMTCQEDEIKDAHIDTRQYNHITWKNPADLHDKLIARIEATLPYKRRNLSKRQLLPDNSEET